MKDIIWISRDQFWSHEKAHIAQLTFVPNSFINSPIKYQDALRKDQKSSCVQRSQALQKATHTLCTTSWPCFSAFPLFSITAFINFCTKSNKDLFSTFP